MSLFIKYLMDDNTNFEKLHELIIKTDSTFIQNYYHIFANRMYQCLTDNQIKMDDRQRWIDLLRLIIRKYKINDIKTFRTLMYILFETNLLDSNSKMLNNTLNEEMQLSLILCISEVIKSVSYEILPLLYEKNVYNGMFLPSLITACIDIAEKEKLRTLRCAALECLMIVMYVYDEADQNDKEIVYDVVEIISYIFPGIMTRIYRIFMGDEKQGHKVTVLALRCWSRILTMVLRDDLKPCEQRKKESKIPLELKQKFPVLQSFEIERDNKWYEFTVKKLEQLTRELIVICYRKYTNPNVRLEAAKMCQLVFENCIENLKLLLKYFIEIIIFLSEDDFESVKTKSEIILNEFIRKYINQNHKNIIESLEDKCYDYITTLPRQIINATDDDTRSCSLNILAAYINTSTKSSTHLPMLDSIEYLNHLIEALIKISEMDVTDISLLEEYSLRDFNELLGVGTPWKQFYYLNSVNVENKFKKICNLLGTTGNVQTIVNLLLDRLHIDHEHSKEIINLINHITATSCQPTQYCTNNCNEKINIISNVLDIYLEQDNWYLSIDFDQSTTTKLQLKSNIVQICLLTEAIGQFSLSLGQNFEKFLLKTIYLLLERAGNKNSLISLAGMKAIDDIKCALGYADVTELLKNNSDYLRYHIIKRLRHVERYPGVLDVLAIIMNHCSINILPCLQEIVHDVLLQSCDKFQFKNATSFLRVFYTFTLCVQRWQTDNPQLILTPHRNKTEILENNMKEKEEFIEEQLNELDKITNEYEQYDEQTTKTIEQMYLEDMKELEHARKMDIDTQQEESEHEHEELKPPIEVQLTCDVMKRCLHFLPSKDRNRKLLVLDTLMNGVDIVQYYENILLPVTHLIWSPLVKRFDENSDPLIIHRSLMLLHKLAKYTETFIRHRTVKEVLPIINTYLTKLASDSYLKDRGAAYRYTQQYKLQLALLEYLPDIIKYLDVDDQSFQETALAATPYLSNKQPGPLQEFCIYFYKNVEKMNSNLLKNSLEKWMDENKENNEFSSNIQKIFQI